MNHDISLVVTITVTCYSWAPSSGDHLFTCGTSPGGHITSLSINWKLYRFYHLYFF